MKIQFLKLLVNISKKILYLKYNCKWIDKKHHWNIDF